METPSLLSSIRQIYVTTRINARVRGASAEQVAKVVRDIQSQRT